MEYRVSNTIEKVKCCAMAVNGEFCVTGSLDHRLIIWNIVDGKIQHRLKGNTHAVIGRCIDILAFIHIPNELN